MSFSMDFALPLLLEYAFAHLHLLTIFQFISSHLHCCRASSIISRHPVLLLFSLHCSQSNLKWKCDFITRLLNAFQWLFIATLIKTNLLNMVYKDFHSMGPACLSKIVSCHALLQSLPSCSTELKLFEAIVFSLTSSNFLSEFWTHSPECPSPQ